MMVPIAIDFVVVGGMPVVRDAIIDRLCAMLLASARGLGFAGLASVAVACRGLHWHCEGGTVVHRRSRCMAAIGW